MRPLLCVVTGLLTLAGCEAHDGVHPEDAVVDSALADDGANDSAELEATTSDSAASEATTSDSAASEATASDSADAEATASDSADAEVTASDSALLTDSGTPEDAPEDAIVPPSDIVSDTPIDPPLDADPPNPCGRGFCPTDTLCCDDADGLPACVDPEADDRHCGACDAACADGERCAERACVCDGADGAPTVCADQETCCPGLGCVSLASDVAHCGACEVACGAGETCDEGACWCGTAEASAPLEPACAQGQACCGEPARCFDAGPNEGRAADPRTAADACTCGELRGDCDLDPANGCETPLDANANCGACGWVCVNTLVCSAGSCVCAPGRDDCNGTEADGCEADLSNDVDACGACGRHCGARATCEQGTCTCNAGFGDCNDRSEDGCETYLVHDDAHCGACGLACEEHQVCAGQRCGCVPGFGDCNQIPSDGCEMGLTTDANCGACGAVCPDGMGCVSETCACDPGRAECNGEPADGCEIDAAQDLSNCGRCGNICPRGQTCAASLCVTGVIDLAITEASITVASVAIGKTLDVTNTLVNDGNAVTTAGYIEVAFYASRDDVIDSSDTLLGTRFTNILGPGGASTAVTTVTIPKTLEPGTYYIGAVADYSAQQAESDEGNNTLTEATVAVVRDVDLVMSAVTLPENAVGLGATIAITNTMTNQGTTALAGAYAEVGLYLSEDPTITSADALVATRFLWTLDPGASSTVVTSARVPPNLEPGLYYLGAIADFSELQPESIEANNALAGDQIEVYRSTDLIISEAFAPVTRINIGENLAVTNTVRNQGTTYSSNAYVEVALYLSPDDAVTTADRALGSRYCANLGGSAASTAVTTIYVPASTEPGRYYLGAVADPGDVHPETDETNNGFAGMFIEVLRDVDLQMTALSIPVTRVAVGGSLEVTSTIANAGTTVTSAPYLQIGLYLSTDANITTQDRAIGTRTLGALAAGASSTAVVSVVVPSDLARGTYYLGAIADPGAQQPEGDETNNAITATAIELQ